MKKYQKFGQLSLNKGRVVKRGRPSIFSDKNLSPVQFSLKKYRPSQKHQNYRPSFCSRPKIQAHEIEKNLTVLQFLNCFIFLKQYEARR